MASATKFAGNPDAFARVAPAARFPCDHVGGHGYWAVWDARLEHAALTDAIEAYDAVRWPRGKIEGGRGRTAQRTVALGETPGLQVSHARAAAPGHRLARSS